MTPSAQINASLNARIVLTRSREDCEAWAAELRTRGFEPIVLPCIETQQLDAPALRAALTEALSGAHWLVVTSRRGVMALAELMGNRLPEQLHVAAVGATTAQASRIHFGRVDFVASQATAACLAQEFAAHLGPKQHSIVLALAENAGNILEQTLRDSGQRCTRFDVYRTIPSAGNGARRRLSELGGQTVFLASPSAVLGFVNQIETDDAARLVSIGPSTTAAIERAGLRVHAQAGSPSLNGMLKAIEE